MELWIKRERFIKIENLDNYLFISARNSAIHYVKQSLVCSDEKSACNVQSNYISGDMKLCYEELYSFIMSEIGSMPEQRRRVLGELLGPRALFAETRLAGVFGDAQDAVDGEDLAGRRRHIAFENRKLVVEPFARLVGRRAADELEFELLVPTECDDYMMLHFSLLPKLFRLF